MLLAFFFPFNIALYFQGDLESQKILMVAIDIDVIIFVNDMRVGMMLAFPIYL